MRDIDEIKQKIDIVEFINEYVPLKKAGRNFHARCPFHNEKSPSFVVSPDRQIWHCFGACNIGGDIFEFFMKWDNISFSEALITLSKKAGVTLSQSIQGDKEWEQKERLLAINHLSAEFYHYVLTKHSSGIVGRSYIKKRGISDKIVDTFMIGYAPMAWRNLLTFLMKKGYQPEEIEKTGLIIKSKDGWYDRFRGRLMFTLKNHRGQVVGFSGRILDPTEKAAKYINTPETILYHKGSLLYGLDVTLDAIRKAGYAIIAEGEFDVLSSFQNGISNIVAIKGTALTEDQLRLLKRFTTEIRLALDMDLAGDAAARRSIELADSLDFNIRVVSIPGGKDLDEALQSDEYNVKEAVKNALSVYDFILDSSKKRYATDDPFGKKKIAAEVLPLYARIGNPIVRNHFVKKLAETIDTSEDAIEEQLEKEQKQIQRGIRPDVEQKAPKEAQHREELLEFHLLCLIVQGSKPTENLQKALKTLTIEDIGSLPLKRIIEKLKAHTGQDYRAIDSFLPKELLDTYNRAFLADVRVIIENKDKFDKELQKTIFAIKKLSLRRKLSSLAAKGEESDETVSGKMQKITQELKRLGNIKI